MKKLLYFIVILSFQTYSQQITGYLYDHKGGVPDFPILNATQNFYSRSDSGGYFTITANVGDSLVLNSLAYNEYKFKVEKGHFESDMVIELSVNSLKEVTINGYKMRPVNIETIEKELRDQITKDILKNPHFMNLPKETSGILLKLCLAYLKKMKKTKSNLREKDS